MIHITAVTNINKAFLVPNNSGQANKLLLQSILIIYQCGSSREFLAEEP
jgi:hypothetical protein